LPEVTHAPPELVAPLARPLTIPTIMDLHTLANVRALLKHLPKAAREKSTWQHVETELKKAASGGETAQASIALQMLLVLERVEYHPIESKNTRRTRGSAG